MEYTSVNKAAKILAVHPDTIRRWVVQGLLEGYRTPTNHRRISLESIKRLLEKDVK